MPAYKAPLRDMRFIYDELLDGKHLQTLEGFDEICPDTIESILEEGAKFCENELLPINRQGDEEGCHIDNGIVTTPKGVKEAYTAFCAAGWNSVTMDQNYGGQGLPKALHVMLDEIICATNIAFGLYPGLTNGAYSALETYASDDIKNTYFPNMANGSWSGSMCLTEAHCGTDLALVRTKAEPNADASYNITGTKIFITAGEHDLTENILHLVLARTPDAPAGIKGISLFLVPKFLVNEDGTLGDRNSLAAGSIEHKMGIKASSTCVMNFDGAKGYLIGTLNKGMQAMFKMMNIERVGVGMQGIGVAEAAYQGAVGYANERLQGRALTGAQFPEKSADPLTVHPDVRRMLLDIRSNVEGCRAVSIWLGMLLDAVSKETDPQQLQDAEDLIALLTPIAKAFFTDVGFESAVLGQQVFGGHGYVREHGMEQLVRDARIAQIYEGTNGVQAMDLVGRKLSANGGRSIRLFMGLVGDFINDNNIDNEMQEFIEPLASGLAHLQQATEFILTNAATDPNTIGSSAYDYMSLMGVVTTGWMWARMAKIALDKQPSEQFYATKVKTARYFSKRIMPKTQAYLTAIQAGADCMMDFDASEF